MVPTFIVQAASVLYHQKPPPDPAIFFAEHSLTCYRCFFSFLDSWPFFSALCRPEPAVYHKPYIQFRMFFFDTHCFLSLDAQLATLHRNFYDIQDNNKRILQILDECNVGMVW